MSESTDQNSNESVYEELLARVRGQESSVGVLGLGYVGLPLALAFAEGGFHVLGFDVDPRKIEQLEAGKSYIDNLESGRVAQAAGDGRLAATADFDRLGEPDVLLICVPTPLNKYREPDLSYVEATVKEITRCLRRGQLIILESTTYPGTTEEVLLPRLEASGLVCGNDFFLAFSPEREDPGNQEFGTTGIPKVIGGCQKEAADVAEALYGQIFAATVRVSSARAAEATKLTENIYRAVNIALVNELKMVYEAMSIDVWEVLDAASTKPFGFQRFNPGPGWGGHCIPVDPFYLTWKARAHGLKTRFIELAGEVNIEMPRYVLAKLQTALNERAKPVKGSKILVLGIAYKPDISDPRESPAFEILDLLLEQGADISYHDPFVPRAPRMRTWPDLPELESVPLNEETLAAQDAVLLVTHHSGVDYELVHSKASLIVDTRGIYRSDDDHVIRA